MIATQHTQSLTDFRQKATETLDRLNRTGEAEILTVNGQARAVLLAPAAYDALTREARLSQDVQIIGRAMAEHAAGQGQEAVAFLDDVRARLLSQKKAGRRK